MFDTPLLTFITRAYETLRFETHTILERSLLQILIILELLIIFYIVMRTLRSVRFLLSKKSLIKNSYSFETSPKVTTAHFVL